jgi:PleD family two-component response regulator
VRCRHVSGKTHEIGVEFGQAIDLREFVAATALGDETGATKSKPAQFSGHLLYVDNRAADAKVVRSLVNAMGVEVCTVATAQEALAHVASAPVDVILAKMALPGTSGLDLVKALRAQGCRAHIVMVVS